MPTKRGLPTYDGTNLARLDTLLNGQSTSLDTALDAIDWYRVGTIAERDAMPTSIRREGMRFEIKSTGQVFRCNAALTWVAESANGTLIPTSVDNGSIDQYGVITPTGSPNLLRVNGVFSARFRAYEATFVLNTTAVTGTTMRMSKNKVPVATTSYNSQRFSASSGAVAGTGNTAQTGWPGAGVANVWLSGTWRFTNPFHTGPKWYAASVTQATGVASADDRGWLGNNDNTQFDGFEISLATGTFIAGNTFVAVKGIA